MNADRTDPLLGALASLSTHAPRPSRKARTLTRCHAAMTPAPVSRPQLAIEASPRMPNRLLALAVVLYGVVTLWEGLRAAGVL